MKVEPEVIDAAAQILALQTELKATKKRLRVIEARHEDQKRVSRILRRAVRTAPEEVTRDGLIRAQARSNLFLQALRLYEQEGVKHQWDISDNAHAEIWKIRREIESLDRVSWRCCCVPARANMLY